MQDETRHQSQISRALSEQVGLPLDKAVRDGLANAQLVEELLRRTIACLHGILSSTASGYLEYRFDEKRVEGKALGRLIEEFKAFANAKTQLMKHLEQYATRRNKFIHQSFIEKPSGRDAAEWEAFAKEGLNILQELIKFNKSIAAKPRNRGGSD